MSVEIKKPLVIAVPFYVKWQTVVDLFTTACEGGSVYWCRMVTPRVEAGDMYESMMHGFTVATRKGDALVEVTPEMIEKGLRLLLEEDPERFFYLCNDDWDAEDADVFFQLCTFGKVIYA